MFLTRASRRLHKLQGFLSVPTHTSSAAVRQLSSQPANGDSLDNYKGKLYPWRYRVEVRWIDMDAMQHVNNATYFTFFETARMNNFEECGFDVDATRAGPNPILADTYCRFKAPIEHPDHVVVGVRMEDVQESSYVQHYAVLSEKSGRVVAEGTGTVVFIDYTTGKRTPVPQVLLDQIAARQGDP